jgi:hypothetical protein
VIAAWIAAYFAKATVYAFFGRVWKGFCDFIATPVGAALVAGFIMFFVGIGHEHRALNAKWEAKWAAAEQKAEVLRVKRDADAKAEIKRDADTRLAALTKRKDELEKQVQTYETQQLLEAASKPAHPPEYTDADDARWLSNALRQRAHVKPQARRGLALRLRVFGR